MAPVGVRAVPQLSPAVASAFPGRSRGCSISSERERGAQAGREGGRAAPGRCHGWFSSSKWALTAALWGREQAGQGRFTAVGQARAEPNLLPSITFMDRMKSRTSSGGALPEEKPWRAGAGGCVRGHPAPLPALLGAPLPRLGSGVQGTGRSSPQQLLGLIPQSPRAVSHEQSSWRLKEARGKSSPLSKQNKIRSNSQPCRREQGQTEN